MQRSRGSVQPLPALHDGAGLSPRLLPGCCLGGTATAQPEQPCLLCRGTAIGMLITAALCMPTLLHTKLAVTTHTAQKNTDLEI